MGRSFRIPACEIQCTEARTLLHVKEKLHRPKSFVEFHSFHNQSYRPLSSFEIEVNKVSKHVISRHQCKSDVVESWCTKKNSVVEKGFVRTLLVDNYDSYTYNIYQELAVINGVPPVVICNDEWTWEEVQHYLYEEHAFDNIVLSPGPGSPTSASDIGICLRILQECKDFPILGICLGHQALGYAHGAQIVHAPSPIHGRLSEIEHTGCELFHGIPSGRNSGFKVVRYHSLVIDSDSLPMELIPIAWASSGHTFSYLESEEPQLSSITSENWTSKHLLHDIGIANGDNRYIQCINSSSGKDSNGVLMSIMHSTRPHYGVQFHPESIATCYGRQLLENFHNITLEYWSDSSLPHRKVSQAFHNAILLPREKFPVKNAFTSKFADIPTMLDNVHRNLRLQWKKLDNFANQVGGSENIFCKLFGGQKNKDTFWLDSSLAYERRARFSFMGGVGGQLWKRLTFRLSNKDGASGQGGGHLSFEDAQGSRGSTFLENGFLDFLEEGLLSFDYQKEEFEGLPFDFVGGYVGFLGYGMKEECGMAPNAHISETPDACFFFVDQFVVIDHSNDDVYILSICDNGSTFSDGRQHDLQSGRSWLDETELKLLTLKATKKDGKMPLLPLSMPHYREAFSMEKSRNEYLKDVARCMRYISDGESYELCLTMQMKKKIEKRDALGLYLHLRNKNPAPHAAWLHFSEENLFICCSSPERFLRLDQEGVLEAKPIKGTIARGSSREEDERHRLQLQYSEKDQAENLMIVDLLRNDLGRVCEPGSVHVPRLMELETYATVHTLVSTIKGKKRADVSPVGCVRSAFPGGSMTGAPKRRSIEILDSLEQSSRGVYSGCIGFFSYNQTFDLNIVIRTIVIHKNEASIGAGGAIVALSKPEDEYEETMLKASALMKAITDYESWSENSSSDA